MISMTDVGDQQYNDSKESTQHRCVIALEIVVFNHPDVQNSFKALLLRVAPEWRLESWITYGHPQGAIWL